MCRPIPGNLVRPKTARDRIVMPLPGSKKVSTKRMVKLTEGVHGMAEGPAKDPDYFFILFEHQAEGVPPGAIVRAKMHHTQLKGVEA